MDSKFEPLSLSSSSHSTEDLLKAKSDIEDNYFDDTALLRNRSRKYFNRFITHVMVHFVLVTVYTLMFFFFLDQNSSS
jgi:hypothetical protein